jgi:glycine/D-amino acid oxidase-like deaminating enzyme
MAADAETGRMRVIVCGCGAIGASTAYFLSLRGAEVVVVERAGVANAASGKSGGFLAYDWCDGTPLQELARRSFTLHASLAEELELTWGYRGMTTYGGFVGSGRASGGRAHSVGWIGDDVTITQRLGSTETTAQVHPGQFTASVLRAAKAAGATVRQAEVRGLARDGDRVGGIETEGGRIESDAVVMAMGPWSILSAAWMPLPAVHGLKGHSLVFETGARLPPEALFLELREPDGAVSSPEVFPRSDGTTYVCAISSESPLPVDPREVGPDAGAFDRLGRMCARISPVLAEAPVIARQACFRPVTEDGLPLIGKVTGVSGVYVATGHSVWGILNAPATGEAMAELILDGGTHAVDVSPFDPGRLRPFDPARRGA